MGQFRRIDRATASRDAAGNADPGVRRQAGLIIDFPRVRSGQDQKFLDRN
jgi:hypothetical protein